ncbi:MAG: tRNA (adenine-N1)-methyltransferase [Anaerolineae bacterium]|nr:tRNA (adenine-N1)-methyltransferase [Anaerolineae bacterium]
MTDNSTRSAAYGDTVLLVSKERDSYVRTLTPGSNLSTHLGSIKHDDLVGKAYGSAVKTHLNHLFYLLPPQPADLIAHARHETAIVQPKDLGYIALKMGVKPGTRVVEAGTGSGVLTMILAMLVGDMGQVISYERKESLHTAVTKNLARSGVAHRVRLVVRDIVEGFDETDADGLFLDLPNPWDYLAQARAALVGGGVFASIVPTMNQVIKLVDAMYQGPWFMIEVEELLLRQYKVMPARIRPDDQMVGHTGYLIFARAVNRAASEGAEPNPPEGATAKELAES